MARGSHENCFCARYRTNCMRVIYGIRFDVLFPYAAFVSLSSVFADSCQGNPWLMYAIQQDRDKGVMTEQARRDHRGVCEGKIRIFEILAVSRHLNSAVLAGARRQGGPIPWRLTIAACSSLCIRYRVRRRYNAGRSQCLGSVINNDQVSGRDHSPLRPSAPSAKRESLG